MPDSNAEQIAATADATRLGRNGQRVRRAAKAGKEAAR